MNRNDLAKTVNEQGSNRKMPVLFIGHGNPMNAITDNIYRQKWAVLGKELVKPVAILCISAHWLIRGSYVTMVDKPKTIHDFGSFPEELYQQNYPAPGAVDFAKLTTQAVKTFNIREDYDWGLDHGTWSILKNMYPLADIPVYQLSVDYSKPPEYHYALARELGSLRDRDVLIIASGNLVHNLQRAKWTGKVPPFDWALEFDSFVKKNIEDFNPKALNEYRKLGAVAQLAHPTNDHYLPLMYAIGLRDKNDQVEFFNDSFDMASMSMRSVIFSQGFNP
jgi:4,5-DOPA dioxygenase extradiol